MAYESTTFDQEMEGGSMESGRQALARVQGRTQETVEDSVDLIRRHPGKAVLVSALLGAAIGALLCNAVMDAYEPTGWERWSALGEDAWERARDGAQEAISGLREAVGAAMERWRSVR